MRSRRRVSGFHRRVRDGASVPDERPARMHHEIARDRQLVGRHFLALQAESPGVGDVKRAAVEHKQTERFGSRGISCLGKGLGSNAWKEEQERHGGYDDSWRRHTCAFYASQPAASYDIGVDLA